MTSLKFEAAVGPEPIAYRLGLRKPKGCDTQVGLDATSAMSAAQMGAADEVPPIVVHPPW